MFVLNWTKELQKKNKKKIQGSQIIFLVVVNKSDKNQNFFLDIPLVEVFGDNPVFMFKNDPVPIVQFISYLLKQPEPNIDACWSPTYFKILYVIYCLKKFS